MPTGCGCDCGYYNAVYDREPPRPWHCAQCGAMLKSLTNKDFLLALEPVPPEPAHPISYQPDEDDLVDHHIAQTACCAAIEFDNLRLERNKSWDSTTELVAMLRRRFPVGGTVMCNTVNIRDILIMKDTLKTCDPAQPVQFVDNVVIAARAWADRIEAAAGANAYTPEIAAFCLALSKFSTARSRVGRGHALR